MAAIAVGPCYRCTISQNSGASGGTASVSRMRQSRAVRSQLAGQWPATNHLVADPAATGQEVVGHWLLTAAATPG
jgi:hypothetical protein